MSTMYDNQTVAYSFFLHSLESKILFCSTTTYNIRGHAVVVLDHGWRINPLFAV